MRLVDHHAQGQSLRPGTGDKGGQRAYLVIAIGVVTRFAILGPRHASCGRQQNQPRFRLLVAPLRQHGRRQARAVGRQLILRLLHQIDERHEPQPQRRPLGRHLGQHARNHVGLARAGRRAQQAGRRRLAEQGRAHVGDQRALEGFRLDGGGLGSHNVEHGQSSLLA